MKQIILPLLATVLFITLVGFFTQKYQTKNSSKEIAVGTKKITVEIADTESARQKGLAGKPALSENTGMLFVFASKKVFPSFWMKDMLIPIDILWIVDDKVYKIDKNIVAPDKGTSDKELALYHPDKPIDYVLEVNAGFSDKNGIKIGDSVDLSSLNR